MCFGNIFQLIINVHSNEVKILYKINDSIITNYDVFEKEII